MKDHRTLLPMGVTETEQGFHVNAVAPGTSCTLVLFRRNEKEPALELPFPESERLGNVWALDVTREELAEAGLSGEALETAEYCFRDDKGFFEDPCGVAYSGRDSWGKIEQYGNQLRSPLFLRPFDWGEDHHPSTPFADTVIYRINVRNFTKSPSSGVVQKGTFDGVIEKIPYLKELGITAVDLMPCQEFEELMIPASDYSGPAALARKPDGRINCWGYVKTHHFAPKASLCRKKDRDPAGEFRELVKAMHAAGIEVYTELYFDGSEDSAYVTSVLRWYVRFFRVDGLHIVGFADIEAASRDPYLARTKIIAQYWKEMPRKGPKLLASCNENFQRDMRRYLKGDEGTLNSLVFHTKNNPLGAAVINYMANTNGFTMMDMVSYDRKHNELNGEGNTDGPDGNFSWNCGVEGPTRKRKITELRRQQLRNAFLLLLLSQGTPLIMAGDEFGNTQGGNNNAYCQDNALWWLNWKLVKSEKALLSFVKNAIAFRKKHRVFHLPEQPKVLDPKATGLPDVSYHGVRAWQPEFEDWHRQLGILYNGRYAADENGVPDNTFYVMYNLHWEPHSFALPHPVKGYQWYIAANTADAEVNGFYPEGEEPAVTGGPEFEIPARGIVVLISKEAPKPAKKAGKKKAEKAEKTEKAVKAEKVEKAGTAEKAEKVEKAGKSEKAGKTEEAEKAGEAEKQADEAKKSEVKAEHQVDETTSGGT